jgi:NAD(P)-dependent dehydrogenase (short-subunit alcohol dehydrogenase family)
MENKVAIVTGAARPWGLGRATAEKFASNGFNVALVDIRDDWGETAAKVVRDKGVRSLYLHTDIQRRDEVQAMVGRVLAEFGRIDVLANVAAICPRERVADLKVETFDQVIRTNLLGTMLTCQAVLKPMREQKGGRIINIASGAALRPYEAGAIYGASKAGVVQFSKVLALEEAANNIVVTVVAPGYMHTAMGRESGPNEEDFQAGAVGQPYGRPLYPAEVAEVIVLAATVTSHALTGQTLHARGGLQPMV